jgi:hypothetical protein
MQIDKPNALGQAGSYRVLTISMTGMISRMKTISAMAQVVMKTWRLKTPGEPVRPPVAGLAEIRMWTS